MYDWLETLEFNLLGLPSADIKIFLHIQYKHSELLKKTRNEKPDQNEADPVHLQNAEVAYLEIVKKYDFKTLECIEVNALKSIQDINEELTHYVIVEHKLLG